MRIMTDEREKKYEMKTGNKGERKDGSAEEGRKMKE